MSGIIDGSQRHRQRLAGYATSPLRAFSSRLTTRFGQLLSVLGQGSDYWQDFFYICPGHLKDKGFCSPDADEAAALEEKKKKEELDKEVEAVKKEYEEKQLLKQEKRKKKEKEKGKDKAEKKAEDEEDTKDEKEKEDKVGIWYPTGAPCLTPADQIALAKVGISV